jgi:hypothetical protein
MSRRSDAGSNRDLRAKKLSRLYIKEEFELDEPPPPRRSMKWLFSLLPIAVFCSSLVMAIAVTVQDSRPKVSIAETPRTEAFRWAVNRAMSAAELTQLANSQEEWSTVAKWWKEAVEFMEVVPRSHPRYDVAREKVQEYQNNLAYALSQAEAQATPLSSSNLWAIGSRRIDLIRTQGKPTQESRYDALCQEILNYGGSVVELSNGVVVNYEDTDRNLRVMAGNEPVTSALTGDGFSWTISSTRADVFSIQGTPDRVVRYDSLNRETLYYGNSSVDLVEDKVIGYNNLGNNLRVAIATIPSGSEDEAAGYWTIGTERNDVFRIQGTPSQINLENSMCKEVLHYGNSVIELRNGFVSGYNNAGGNLRVRVR